MIDRVARDRDEVIGLMVEYMRERVPGWRPESPADLGMTLIEVLAAHADRLAYQQDAVATEAYIGTARRRISVARHARLLGVPADDGCNARTWLHIEVAQAAVVDVPAGTVVFTRVAGTPDIVAPEVVDRVLADHSPIVFETMHSATVRGDHNSFALHTAGQPTVVGVGATRVVLCGHHPQLKSGDVLCVCGPTAQLVRLVSPPELTHAGGHPVTVAMWGRGDALRHRVTCSGMASPHSCTSDVGVLGNIVLADHGRTTRGHEAEQTGRVGARRHVWRVPAGDLTIAEPLCPSGGLDARSALRQDRERAVPAIELSSLGEPWGGPWRPTRDLLACHRFAHRFAVEFDDDGWALLRFGDGRAGREVAEGTGFVGTLRYGTGPRGNIAAASIAHIVRDDTGNLEGSGVVGVTNVVAGAGGAVAESVEALRLRAPRSWRRSESCVSPTDYAEYACRFQGVVGAVGRWRVGEAATIELFIATDAAAVTATDVAGLLGEVRAWLEPRRVIGHVLDLRPAPQAAIVTELAVLVDRGTDRVAVSRSLHQTFTDAGLFAVGRFRIGETVHASAIVGLASRVPGVLAADLTRLVRVDGRGAGASVAASIQVDPWEVAQINEPLLRVTVSEQR